MNEKERSRSSRREAALASLARVDAAEVLDRFRRFLEAHPGGVQEWDRLFFDFISRHADERLLSGSAGGGFDFVFSARDRSGFWVLEAADGGLGKGFLTPHDARRLFELAREKGLAT